MINNSTTDSTVTKDYSQLTRWLCLFEAVNIISEAAEKRGVKDCLKPIPINKYINERYHSVLKDVEYEFNNNHHTHRH